MTDPVDPNVTPSAHFLDFEPVITSPNPQRYTNSLTGQGRWFHARDPDTDGYYGIVYTDDHKTLSVLAVDGTSAQHVQRMLDAIYQAYDDHVSATEEFDHLATNYASAPVEAGELSTLLQ